MNLMAAAYPASVENPSAPYFISSTLGDEARADCGKYREHSILITSEVMRPRFLNRDEFAQVVRNTPLVAIDLIIRNPDRCVLVGLSSGRTSK